MTAYRFASKLELQAKQTGLQTSWSAYGVWVPYSLLLEQTQPLPQILRDLGYARQAAERQTSHISAVATSSALGGERGLVVASVYARRAQNQ